MALVYRHIRLDTGKPFYFGIGKTEKRAHFIHGRNNLWKKIVAKTEYRVEILFRDLTWKQACEKEKEFIKLYGRIDLGTGILCNMTDGGDGGSSVVYTDERREKISRASTGRKKTDEEKLKISRAHRGKIFSNETIQKMKDTRRGTKPINYDTSKPIFVEKNNNWFCISRGNYIGTFTTEQEAFDALQLYRKTGIIPERKRKQRKQRVYTYYRKNKNKPWFFINKIEGWSKSFHTEQEAQEAINKWLVENQSKNVLP